MSVAPDIGTWVHESDSPHGFPGPSGCCSPRLPGPQQLPGCPDASHSEEGSAKSCHDKNGMALTQRMSSSTGWKAVQGKTPALPASQTRQRGSPQLSCSGAGLGGCVVITLGCSQRHSEVISLPGCLDHFLLFAFP